MFVLTQFFRSVISTAPRPRARLRSRHRLLPDAVRKCSTTSRSSFRPPEVCLDDGYLIKQTGFVSFIHSCGLLFTVYHGAR